MKFICHIVQIIKNTMLKWKQKDESARNYSIIIYDENAMEIGNNADIADCYGTNICSGQHTTTYPHNHLTKLSHIR
jgi:hypothetical protein